MNKIQYKIAVAKKKAERAANLAYINNPIRVRREKKHNKNVEAIIAANGGRMTDEQWNQTLVGQIMNGTHPSQISIKDALGL